MSRVVLHFSMSLDGYVTGPNVTARDAMGVGGDRLHEWMFPSDAGPRHESTATDAAQVKHIFDVTGAVVVGRRTYDLGVPHWGDTPYPAPSFVLTHNPRPDEQMKSAAFRFVTDVESAVQQAKQAAGDKEVTVMGAATAQQVLRAGLADALRIQLVSVMLCGGTRLFDKIGDAHIELVRTQVAAGSPDVTHLEYDVINQA
jgi:dihydrofolate reductase